MNNVDIYKNILDEIYHGIFVTNKDGIILYCNEAFCRSYNLNSNDIIGKSVAVVRNRIKKGKQIIPIVMKEKEEISLFQETIYGKKLFLNAKPILDGNGEITMIIETVVEVLNTESNYPYFTIEDIDLKEKKDDETNINDLVEYENLERIAQFDVTVLLLGESGTGKSTCAKFIHELSPRKDNPFVTINCTTLPENLIESELFGYVKGAFTGAMKEGKKGLVELANKGTLFLDEIGDLPLTSQSKLLELIENKTFMPIGGSLKKQTDIRIIAATNKDIKEMINKGTFREDLYYRLNVMEWKLPPLKNRKEEIPSLISIFVKNFNEKYNMQKEFDEDAIEELKRYDWPGNIRELKHIVEKIMISIRQDKIVLEDIEKFLKTIESEYPKDDLKIPTLKEYLDGFEKILILTAYNKYRNSYKVAEVLDISQSQASRKIRKYIYK
ncbi:sigma 54-interacting transcriptional regulator [uncultured Clostridium sp.]|uniref:sigma-54 interaction domain-containing protein n=1 Tax=uncultured Clostridium sp. TaxID=59620 RepID=UPI00261319D9|nr:sigma 54-interacting transcriptional regulator [uncultured Clostridium sp.]